MSGDDHNDVLHDIAKWKISKREMLRLTIRRYRGVVFADLRKWFRDVDGDLAPGKGITIRPQDVKRVRAALRKAVKCLEERS